MHLIILIHIKSIKSIQAKIIKFFLGVRAAVQTSIMSGRGVVVVVARISTLFQLRCAL